jgi:predicted anti-sigma-YlaC factor YlaD
VTATVRWLPFLSVTVMIVAPGASAVTATLAMYGSSRPACVGVTLAATAATAVLEETTEYTLAYCVQAVKLALCPAMIVRADGVTTNG